MKKATIIKLLSALTFALAAWAGGNIVSNKVDIAKIKTRKETMYEDIKEIKNDIKKLLSTRK